MVATGWDIYAQQLDADGNYKLEGVVNGYGICTHEGDQEFPMFANNSPNDVVYAWRDTRDWLTLAYDIYTLGIDEPVEYNYHIESHDITDPDGPDLAAQILFNGLPFATPLVTPYTFGAAGNEPILAGTYSVWHDDYDNWEPVSHTIINIEQNDATDFLGIRYILNITSSTPGYGINRDAINLGLLTNSTIFNSNVGILTGDYTLETAPFGFVWTPTNNAVVAGDFNAGNNYTYSIHFDLLPITLPVELSSFTAIATSDNFAQIKWVTQTETGLAGFYIYRNTEPALSTSIKVSPIITATNTSQEVSYNYVDQEISGLGTWYYWLQSFDMNGDIRFHGPALVTISNSTTPDIPTINMLSNVYPNPFKSLTSIHYETSKSQKVSIDVYNVLGQKVRSLISDNKNAGTYHIDWNGKDNNGRKCSTGIYYIKMSAGEYQASRKIVLIK